MKRPSLLVLSPRFPYPVVGGDRLRIFQVCKELASRFDITLLSLCETDFEMSMRVPDDGVFVRIERVFLPRYRSYLNAALALIGGSPLQVAYYRSSVFQDAVDRLLPEHDAVLSHLIRCAEYVRHSSKPKFLEMTDAISLNYERVRARKDKSGFMGLVYSVESRRLKRYERALLKEFDLSVLVSEVDKAHLVGADTEAQSGLVLVCSNGVDFCQLPFADRSASSPVIAYIGNMSSFQNMDACLFFAREVMPVVRKRMDAIFRVVGKISDSDAARLRAYDNVEVLGPVSDIAEAVKDARVGVCPVRLGAGVQNKVLEYMALGLPVVCSRIGYEGFMAKPDEDLLLADTPEEYADQIEKIWNMSDYAAQLARHGRSYVELHHDWSARLRPMVDAIFELVSRRK